MPLALSAPPIEECRTAAYYLHHDSRLGELSALMTFPRLDDWTSFNCHVVG